MDWLRMDSASGLIIDGEAAHSDRLGYSVSLSS